MEPSFLLLVSVVPVLLASACTDLRSLRIPNSHVLLALALFAGTAPFLLVWPELSARLVTAALAFALGFVLFALRLFGGGDVKMMPVLLFFIPSQDLDLFLRLFAFALLAVSLAVLAIQSPAFANRRGGVGVKSRRHVPVGVAMALSTVMLVGLSVPA